MKITGIHSFHADGGWRPFSFLKMTTDDGLTGWAEYSCGPWAPALPGIIEVLAQNVLGRDPRDFRVLRQELNAITRFAPGGLNCQAIAAIENACIDIAAKAAGQPAWKYFGGALREKIDLYWTHCGSFRARDSDLFAHLFDHEPLVDLDSMKRLGEEVVRRGFKAAKTNPIMFAPAGPVLLNPGFVVRGLDHSGALASDTLYAIEAQLEAFRDGVGQSTDLMLDVNFAYSPQSVARLERAVRKHRLRWLEYDHRVPGALVGLKSQMATPLASLEAVYESLGYAPFLEGQAVDIAVIDVLWNGFDEASRIAAYSCANGINVAPHNFYGPLADLIAANFCAIVPNLEIMEFEADDVPWKYDLLTQPLAIGDGAILIPTGDGWGADINEAALLEHPWPRKL